MAAVIPTPHLRKLVRKITAALIVHLILRLTHPCTERKEFNPTIFVDKLDDTSLQRLSVDVELHVDASARRNNSHPCLTLL